MHCVMNNVYDVRKDMEKGMKKILSTVLAAAIAVSSAVLVPVATVSAAAGSWNESDIKPLLD